MAGYESAVEIKVRGYHLDVYGHVNNARFLEFLEEGRWAWSEGTLDFERWQKQDILLPIVNINIDYHYPAGLGDVLQVITRLENIGKSSVVLHQTMYIKDTETKVIEAKITFVCVDSRTGKAIPLEGELRAVFEGLA